MDIDVENPTRIGRDMFILSKGHAIAALASVYADPAGYFGKDILKNSVNRLYTKQPGPLLPNSRVNRPAWAGAFNVNRFIIAGKDTSFDVYCILETG